MSLEGILSADLKIHLGPRARWIGERSKWRVWFNSQPITTCPTFALACLQVFLHVQFHSAPPLFQGYSRALTAVPWHRPLGGAVAPPTRSGDAKEAEALPNGAWSWGSAGAGRAGFSLVRLSLPFSCCPVSKPVPPPTPRSPRPTTACFPPPLEVLGFLTRQAKVGPEAEAGGEQERLRPGGSLPLKPLQASSLPGPKERGRAPAAATLRHPLARPSQVRTKGESGLQGQPLGGKGPEPLRGQSTVYINSAAFLLGPWSKKPVIWDSSFDPFHIPST